MGVSSLAATSKCACGVSEGFRHHAEKQICVHREKSARARDFRVLRGMRHSGQVAGGDNCRVGSDWVCVSIVQLGAMDLSRMGGAWYYSIWEMLI